MVSPSVVQTVGYLIRARLLLDRRGPGYAGAPARRWTNLAPVPVTSGSAFSSGTGGLEDDLRHGPSLTRARHM